MKVFLIKTDIRRTKTSVVSVVTENKLGVVLDTGKTVQIKWLSLSCNIGVFILIYLDR